MGDGGLKRDVYDGIYVGCVRGVAWEPLSARAHRARARATRSRRWRLCGWRRLAADVGVLREAVDVVVDAVGVPGACAECGEGTSDGPGPLQPLPGFKVV